MDAGRNSRLLAKCHRAENHQRQQGQLAKKVRSLTTRRERGDQAKRAAKKATKTRPTSARRQPGARRRASREAVENVAAEQQSYELPEEKPANEAVTAEQPCQSRSTSETPPLLGRGWVASGPSKDPVWGRIDPTGRRRNPTNLKQRA